MVDPVFEPLRQLKSPIFVMPYENIDTDQILPARFMTTARRVNLADALFRDLRDRGTSEPAAELDRIDHGTRRALVAGRNFGAGSSREHAVWALADCGFRVIISSKIADIFAGNAARNGMLTIEVPNPINEALLKSRGMDVQVDLLGGMLTVPGIGLSHSFSMDPFARLCLSEGRDPLAFLLGQSSEIARYAQLGCVPSPDLRAALGLITRN